MRVAHAQLIPLVSRPDIGEMLSIGEPMKFRWAKKKEIEEVSIELFCGCARIAIVTHSLQNEGYATWRAPVKVRRTLKALLRSIGTAAVWRVRV